MQRAISVKRETAPGQRACAARIANPNPHSEAKPRRDRAGQRDGGAGKEEIHPHFGRDAPGDAVPGQAVIESERLDQEQVRHQGPRRGRA